MRALTAGWPQYRALLLRISKVLVPDFSLKKCERSACHGIHRVLFEGVNDAVISISNMVRTSHMSSTLPLQADSGGLEIRYPRDGARGSDGCVHAAQIFV